MLVSLAQIASSFIAPALAAAGVAAVAIPILIHLLSRLRRKRQRWGAMRFLRLAYQKQKNRLRLEQWLLLATRCLLVLLIGLALAGPVVSGAVAAWFSGGGSGGRVVHVVLDDALVTRAGEKSGFEVLRGEAQQVVEALGPGDRVALWVTHRRGEAARRDENKKVGGDIRGFAPRKGLSPRLGEEEGGATGDRAAALRALEGHVPAFVGADWAGTMEAVAEEVARDRTAGGRSLVVVLSNFARGGGGLLEPASLELNGLGESAAVAIRRPSVSRANRQVVSVVPRRSVVLADAVTGGAMQAAVEVRRFGDSAESATGTLRGELLRTGTEAGEALEVASSVQRPVRWATGQGALVATLSVPLPALEPGVDEAAYVLRVTLLGDEGADALGADDVRLAVVKVQRAWRVGVLDDLSADVGEGSGLTPGRFVSAALGGSGVEVEPVSGIDSAALEPLSAVFVLAPQRVDDSGWEALSVFAKRGGLVWLTPPVDAGTPLTWLSRARRALGTAWEVASGDAAGRADEQKTSGGGVASGVRLLAEPALLDIERDAPAALSLLAGDWARLLGPVRVERYVPLAGVSEAGWLWMNVPGGAGGSGGGSPLLVAEPVGRGTVVLQTAAVDPAWGNLPTKPVFPALVQDVLRSALGRGLGDREWVSGEVPRVAGGVLGREDFEFVGGAGVPVAAAAAGGDAARPGMLRFASVEGVGVSEGAAFWPGVYQPVSVMGSAGGALPMVVNVDADGGDTTALSEAELSAWWNGVGPWAWLPEDVTAVLDTEAPRVNLGWWLLWLVLVLVLVEAWLSRAFSHADTQTRSLGERVSAAVRHLRHGEAGGVLRGSGSGSRGGGGNRGGGGSRNKREAA